MLILAADTSGKHGSIALVQCEHDPLSTLELVPLQGGTFSAELVPQIAELLSRHNLSKSDIDAFAVASGPGSFTGLRVGLAAIKALAEILQKPIAAVSLLEVIAFDLNCDSHFLQDRRESGHPAKSGNRVLVALDAGRSEAYIGEYESGAELPICISESLLTFDELAERASQSPVYTPDEDVITALASRGAGSQVFRAPRLDAVSVARLGNPKILAGQTVSPEQLDASYIRRADAEIKKPVRTPA
jgi:tRNA threonylcarbamoyladenosine biosynthesis protein TsaB